MRLFIAADFPDEIKERLYTYTDKLKEPIGRANWSRHENYHVTLAFLGETDESLAAEVIF